MIISKNKEEIQKAREYWYNRHKEWGDRCEKCAYFKENEFVKNLDWCNYHEEHILDKKNEVCADYL